MTTPLSDGGDYRTSPVRLFYVDDSGAPATGWIVYSWIECTATDWRVGLRAWLDLRKKLFAEHGIPPSYELHAAPFIGGQGNPSVHEGWNRYKHKRNEAMRLALAQIAATAQLRVGTVYRVTSARGRQYAAERGDVYAHLVRHLDARLAVTGELGMIFMDGDGSEHAYFHAHRELTLAIRNVIEDPLFQASHRNQWVQMADLAAWCAYQALRRGSNRRFAWDWYDKHLLASDVNGGPVPV